MGRITKEQLQESKPLEGLVSGVFRRISDGCLAQLIKDPKERERVTELTISTVENLNAVLAMGYPVSINISRMDEATQDWDYYGKKGERLRAHFYFKKAENEIPARGVLTIDPYYYLETALSHKGSFPWELVGTLAHEMHHGHMHDIADTAMEVEGQKKIDGKVEYDQLRYELAANMFAYKYTSAIKPENFKDVVNQWFYLREIKDTIRRQEKARERLT